MARKMSLRNNFLAIFSAAMLSACGGEAVVADTQKVRPAKIVSVEAATNTRDLSFPAVVRAAQSAELTFQISGEIEALNVLEGDEVEEGFVIAQLDQRNARNNLAQAQAEFRNAEAEYQRAERLVAQDAISQSTLDARRTQRDIAAVALSNAEKALADTVLTAPFSGGISRVYPQQYQNIQAKEQIVLIQSNEVEAVIDVPGTIIARIPQLVPVETRVVLDAAPDIEIPGTYKEAAGQADANTQTYEITFAFEPPENLLILPGMTANVSTTFIFDGAKDVIPDGVAAPLSSILAEGADTFVWVVDPETMQLSKRKVIVSGDAGENVIVTDGLNGDEKIVAAGVSFFHEGMTVRPWAPE